MSQLPSPLKSGDVFKSSAVKAINALIDYIKSHELKGDNRTIRLNQTPSGIMISAIRPGGGGGYGTAPEPYDGPFAVSYDAERELLRVNGGWCNINGYKFTEVAGTDSITPEAGKLCLRVRFDAAAQKITDPEFVIAEPDPENFPLAEIEIIETGENEKYVEIRQYYVTVAVFLLGRECIYAKNKGTIS